MVATVADVDRPVGQPLLDHHLVVDGPSGKLSQVGHEADHHVGGQVDVVGPGYHVGGPGGRRELGDGGPGRQAPGLGSCRP